jgi:hydroxymethylpyrimidine pyrophosphatase-like HAD family hydrolase
MISCLTKKLKDPLEHVPNYVVNDNWLLEKHFDVVVYSMNQVMYHVEDLSVESEDNMFDQMTKDLWLKENLHEYERVEDEMMNKEMSRLFETTNWQRNIYLIQPMEEM